MRSKGPRNEDAIVAQPVIEITSDPRTFAKLAFLGVLAGTMHVLQRIRHGGVIELPASAFPKTESDVLPKSTGCRGVELGPRDVFHCARSIGYAVVVVAVVVVAAVLTAQGPQTLRHDEPGQGDPGDEIRPPPS